MDRTGGTTGNQDEGQTPRTWLARRACNSMKIKEANKGNPNAVVFATEKINELKGNGLVAKVVIPMGSTIFREMGMVLGETPKSFSCWAEYNIMVSQEARTLPKDWLREFFNLPAPQEEIRGKFAARFDNGSIPFSSRGRYLRVLGLTAADLNHACVPNSQVTFVEQRPEHGGSYILCRACKEIGPGEEITVGYGHIHNVHEARQVLTTHWFGFRCACQDCLHPKFETEGNFGHIATISPMTIDPQLIAQEPARVFKLCHGILEAYIGSDLVDMRWVKVMERCAYVSAYHSDAGRAIIFLEIARENYLLTEGPGGPDYIRTDTLLQDITKIPDFGVTDRGLSYKEDATVIGALQGHAIRIAFMLNTPNDRYLKLRKMNFVEPSESTTSTEWMETPQGSDENIDVNQLINDLQLEKKNHDAERQGGGTSSKKKGRVKGKGRKKRRGNVSQKASASSEELNTAGKLKRGKGRA